MRQDPIFTSWLVRCPSPQESQRLQHWVTTAIDLDAMVADVVRAYPDGIASSSTVMYRLGDYFAKIGLFPAEGEETGFRVIFHRRPDAGRPWKDLMARVLQDIRRNSADITTTLEYRGDEEPKTLNVVR